jgi:hypothetical protein
MTDRFIEQHFLLVFVVLWCGILFLISLTGGWFQLSLKYRARGHFNGNTWWFQSASFRYLVGYGNCLLVGANEKGIRLSVLFPFRPFHPPLFIPWSDIKAEKHTSFFMKMTQLRFAQCPSAPIDVRAKLMMKIARSVSIEEKSQEAQPGV